MAIEEVAKETDLPDLFLLFLMRRAWLARLESLLTFARTGSEPAIRGYATGRPDQDLLRDSARPEAHLGLEP